MKLGQKAGWGVVLEQVWNAERVKSRIDQIYNIIIVFLLFWEDKTCELFSWLSGGLGFIVVFCSRLLCL